MSKQYFTQSQAALAASFAVAADKKPDSPNWTAAQIDKERAVALDDAGEYDPLPVARLIANAKEFSTFKKIEPFDNGFGYRWHVVADGVRITFETRMGPVELGFQTPFGPGAK